MPNLKGCNYINMLRPRTPFNPLFEYLAFIVFYIFWEPAFARKVFPINLNPLKYSRCTTKYSRCILPNIPVVLPNITVVLPNIPVVLPNSPSSWVLIGGPTNKKTIKDLDFFMESLIWGTRENHGNFLLLLDSL